MLTVEPLGVFGTTSEVRSGPLTEGWDVHEYACAGTMLFSLGPHSYTSFPLSTATTPYDKFLFSLFR